MNSILRIWWISLIFKLVLAAIIPLCPDEAYYWVWSKHLQLSYYDHPGMIAWLFKVGSLFEFLGNGVRWPIVILGHLTVLIWIKILSSLFNHETSKQWLWLSLSSPLLGFGSIIATPDVPVVFFWSVSVFLFLELERNPSWKSFAMLGSALGLGFCAKYHIVLFPVLVFFYIFLEKKFHLLRVKDILIAVLFGLFFSLPVIIWNVRHDFISFKFQIEHGLGQNIWKPFWTYSYVLGQIAAVFPIVFWAAFRKRTSNKGRFLYYVAWGPLLFFLFSSFKGKVELNWPIIAVPAILGLAAANERFRRYFKLAHIFWFCLLSFFSINLFFPMLENTPAKLQEPVQYRKLENLQAQYSPLFAGTYQMASRLWFKSKKPVYKLYKMSREDFFDHIEGSIPTTSQFFVVSDFECDLPNWITTASYAVKRIQEWDTTFVLYEVTKK